MNRWPWIACLLLTLSCGGGDAETTPPVAPEDTNPPPVCLTQPEASGAAVAIHKGPYLQWPTTTSMVVRMETDVDTPATGL